MNVGEAGYYYGLGLPDTIAKIAVGRIPWQVAKKLQLRILSVDKTGRVQEITSKDLKKKQSQKEDALLIETRWQEPLPPYSEIRQELKKKRRLK